MTRKDYILIAKILKASGKAGVGPYTLDSLALSQATLELGMVIKDCVILGSAGMEVAVRVAAADSGSISATDGWRHAMGATSAGLRIVTTLSLGSFGAHTSRLLPASTRL